MGAFSSSGESPPTSMLILLLLQAWLLGLSFASAEFLTPVPEHGNATMADLCQKDTVMSCNLVMIDIARLHDSSMDFMGTTLDFKDMPGDNTYTFSSGSSEASFTVDSDLGAVWGHVQLEDGRDFVIEPSLHICDGCHVVIEEDEEAFPPDHAETLPPSDNVNEETRSNAAALIELGKMDQTTIETFSIMLYYTPEARAAVETSGKDFNAYIELVIATTNQGYINSQIPIRAKLHCLEETPEPEAYFTNSQDMLGVFRDYNGGGNNLRRSADTAVLLTTDCGTASGWGYVVTDGNYKYRAVSMVRYDYAVENYIFGHEIGHNLGLDHDKYQPKAGYLPGALGYHVPGTSQHTIMAYANGIRRSPVNFYSNPKLVINGYRLGKDGEADAAKQMTSVRFAIAANGDESEACQPRGCIIEELVGYYDPSFVIGGKYATKVGSQDDCARLSLATHGSYFWSYVPVLGDCYVKATNLDPRPNAYAVSGNRECGRN